MFMDLIAIIEMIVIMTIARIIAGVIVINRKRRRSRAGKRETRNRGRGRSPTCRPGTRIWLDQWKAWGRTIRFSARIVI